MINVYNICYSEDREILKRSKTLREYSRFIGLVKKYLDDERMSLEKAVEAAVKDAKKEGLEEGRFEGEASGRATVVKAMKNEGIDVNAIVKVSGFSAEEIEKP